MFIRKQNIIISVVACIVTYVILNGHLPIFEHLLAAISVGLFALGLTEAADAC
jgi:Ca2+/Na+ antiporter